MVRELDLGFNRVICHCRKKQKGSHHQHFIRLHQGID
jgi:hypothetical protein